MNGYKVTLFQRISHNGKFYCNLDRFEIVHAHNEDDARRKVTIKPYSIYDPCDGGVVVEADEEYAYSIVNLGQVHKHTEVYFTYGKDEYRP